MNTWLKYVDAWVGFSDLLLKGFFVVCIGLLLVRLLVGFVKKIFR